MYDALIVVNRLKDKDRVLNELGLEGNHNILVKGINENTFHGLRFKELILAADIIIENDRQENLVDYLMHLMARYQW